MLPVLMCCWILQSAQLLCLFSQLPMSNGQGSAGQGSQSSVLKPMSENVDVYQPPVTTEVTAPSTSTSETVYCHTSYPGTDFEETISPGLPVGEDDEEKENGTVTSRYI